MNMATRFDASPATGSALTPQTTKTTGSRKKRGRKRHNNAVDPALITVRGFHTPVTSGGEESECSRSCSPKRFEDYINSARNSPASRPSPTTKVVSALRMQLDALSLNTSVGVPNSRCLSLVTDSRNSPSTLATPALSQTREGPGGMDTYEVPLEHDFASHEAPAKPTHNVPPESELHRYGDYDHTRKMTAADFEPLTCLGTGTYGTVVLVKQRATGRLYAQKQFRKASLVIHKRLVEQTKTERAILESVNRHPFVVKLYYAFQDHEKLYLILEYAQGGELFHHLAMERMFGEGVAAFYMAEMVLALEHLHHNVGVVYRDLKPENCLLDADGHLLLTDFGLSKVALHADETCRSILGTLEYMAPEVIMGLDYGMAVDWWSLGALGFDLLTGGPPFTGNNHSKIREKILKQKLVLPYFLGPDAKDLLTRLLRKEPRKRLGSNMPKDMQTIKGHRFFRKIDWQALEDRQAEPPIRPLVTDPELAENFSRDFTDMAVSPVATSARKSFSVGGAPVSVDADDVFGGFSFVASPSMLSSGYWNM